MKPDILVLGAGIVGVSVAVHLQMRGHHVVLVDRGRPGRETSFGNSGLIQREGVYPYAFPRGLGSLLRYAANRTTEAHYHPAALPGLLPFLARYWFHSRPARHDAIARLYAPLIAASVDEHMALARAAGASHLIRPTGWLHLHRTPRRLEAELNVASALQREFGIHSHVLGRAELGALEPSLASDLIGGVHWRDAASVSNPEALTLAYLALFERLGGTVAQGDAASLARAGAGWRMRVAEGSVEAEQAVVALGPWADTVTRKLGYRLPLAVKRGYHMHYGLTGNAVLNHPVLDAERGYMLVPMEGRVRLTTGAEFADRDASPTPVQLERIEPLARATLPLGERLDSEPWMGRRPCTPDMMPIIGPAPRHRGLWFAFGHAHHGLTLGPVTGRLVAEMIGGEPPFVDPEPYRASRPALA